MRLATRTEYCSVSTHTIGGIAEAERLLANGWQIYRSGMFMIWFRRKIKR